MTRYALSSRLGLLVCLVSGCGAMQNGDAGVDAGPMDVSRGTCGAIQAPSLGDLWLIEAPLPPGFQPPPEPCTTPGVNVATCAKATFNGGLQLRLATGNGWVVTWKGAAAPHAPPRIIEGEEILVGIGAQGLTLGRPDGGLAWSNAGGDRWMPAPHQSFPTGVFGVAATRVETCRTGTTACSSRFFGLVVQTVPPTDIPSGSVVEFETSTGRWQVLWNDELRDEACGSGALDQMPADTSTGHVISRIGP